MSHKSRFFFLAMKCLKIATLFLLELQKKPLALEHGEELIKRLLFQKHLLEIGNLNPNQCCVS